ncbi:MAG: phytoene desaturase family protein [Lepagella sp.]
MNKSAVIIGAGLGGLFTGAFLAKNGHKITILEKNDTIGGGLQCFRRLDKSFETGMHILGGFRPGGNLYKMCKYLGILHKLKLHHIDDDCMDEIFYHSSGEVFRIPSGRHRFVERLSSYFPHEAEGIRNYVEQLYRITDEISLFHLGEGPYELLFNSEIATWPADRLIAQFVSDPKLQEILAYLCPIYGGVREHTPAYIHALINVLYINGASRFVDGSQHFADALRDVILQCGGEVIPSSEVVNVEVVDKSVSAISTADGRRFSADIFVSSIHPTELVSMIPQGTFSRFFVKRINEIPVSYSAFGLFIDLKPGQFPYIDHTCYLMKDFGSMWNQDKCDPDLWPAGFMYMTPPDSGQGLFADRLLIHSIMSYDQVRQWENTSVGHRDEKYLKWKEGCVERLISAMELRYPGFRDMISHVYAASPLTIRDYYHTKEGAIFGYQKDCQDLFFSRLPVYTKLRNLFLTGQNVNLHGICGVPLTALLTANAILGSNSLVNQIKNV